MKKILVATIGTRDLMFQTKEDTWYNIGNDRQVDDIISQQNQVTESLGLDWEIYKSFRKLSCYLLENIEQYQDSLKPAIWGNLFQDLKEDLEIVYLIGTDQLETVKQSEKDTIYASKIIANYLNNIGIQTEIVPFGKDGLNPSNFEQMFEWWQQIWDTKIHVGDKELILCLKGGVGQTAEAGRTSALGCFGEQVSFYDSKENPEQNQKGIPSDYIGPTLGTNYLWSRVQKQALDLLENHNYLAVQKLLAAYFKQDTKGWGSTPTLLKGAIAWNQGNFDTFFKYAKSSLDTSQQAQEKQYWWQAYEQGYTAVIRLNQDNTTEAMLHSFRTIEGLIYEWMQRSFKEHIIYVKKQDNEYPVLSKSVQSIYPNLVDLFNRFDKANIGTVRISGEVQAALVLAYIPQANSSKDFTAWNSKPARDIRNYLSHRLGGISRQELFSAWGKDIKDFEVWEKRILGCINLIAGKSFGSFQQASLFPAIHYQLQQKIENYQV